MTDIVERLYRAADQQAYNNNAVLSTLLAGAADEIERLRSLAFQNGVERLRTHEPNTWNAAKPLLLEAADEIERLRAELLLSGEPRGFAMVGSASIDAETLKRHPDAVSYYENLLDEQAAEIERLSEDLKETNAEIDRLEQDMASLETTLMGRDEEIERLREALENIRELSELTAAKEKRTTLDGPPIGPTDRFIHGVCAIAHAALSQNEGE